MPPLAVNAPETLKVSSLSPLTAPPKVSLPFKTKSLPIVSLPRVTVIEPLLGLK